MNQSRNRFLHPPWVLVCTLLPGKLIFSILGIVLFPVKSQLSMIDGLLIFSKLFCILLPKRVFLTLPLFLAAPVRFEVLPKAEAQPAELQDLRPSGERATC